MRHIAGMIAAQDREREDTMIKAEHGCELMVRFRDGEALPDGLIDLGVESGVIVNGVGMLRDIELGYWDGKNYVTEKISEPVELLSLQGNIGKKDGETIVHAHVTVAKKGGAAYGGHILRATVHNTAEIFICKLEKIRLVRRMEETGLAGLYPEIS